MRLHSEHRRALAQLLQRWAVHLDPQSAQVAEGQVLDCDRESYGTAAPTETLCVAQSKLAGGPPAYPTSTADCYDAILRVATRIDAPFPWSVADPRAGQPEGHGGECTWKRCKELATMGLLRQVFLPSGEPLRMKGIHGSPNQVFEIVRPA